MTLTQFLALLVACAKIVLVVWIIGFALVAIGATCVFILVIKLVSREFGFGRGRRSQTLHDVLARARRL